MKTILTDSEIEALRQIRNNIMQYGRPPSVRELMKQLGYNSPRSISYLFEKLKAKRIIKRQGRDIKIIADFEGDESRVNTIDVPLVGEIACGMPVFAEQNIVDKIPVSIRLASPPHRYYILRVKGDSMNEKGINSGDLLLVRQQQTAKNGDIVVALIVDEVTIKEYKEIDETTIALIPHSTNPKHKLVILNKDFMIQGVVVKVLPGFINDVKEQKKANLLEKKIKAEPFLKWAGGKGQLLGKFAKLFPERFKGYIEPFVGGGAVFFYLHSNGLLKGKKSIIIDSNNELITAYKTIKNFNKLKEVINLLSGGKYQNNKESFYRIRAEESENEIERTARLIFLNKTCFNGLYRVNSKGKFNVPFGRYNNPLICDTENLMAVNNALVDTEIINGDFTLVLKYAEKGDFIYFDPPYQPLSRTSNFTGYTKDSFGKKDQQRLSEVYKKLDKRGCLLMLSNSDVKFIRNLYKEYKIEVVKAKRMINSKVSGRAAINELVILNY